MEKRLTVLLVGLFLSIGMALAQNKVTGTVLEDNGEPCIGATVMIQGTKQGTKTDMNGHFTINVPAGKKLVVSYIGMVTQTVTPKNGMKITLKTDAHTVDEVVVTLTGTSATLFQLGWLASHSGSSIGHFHDRRCQ